MEKAEEIRLIKQATQHGDASAFRALIDHHYGTIYKIAFKWCGHKQDAEDIAQEVCIKVARTIGSFKGDSAFTSWLYTITVNTAKDMFRRRAGRKEREAGFAELNAMEGETEPLQDEMAMKKQALSAIANLPDDIKAAVLLVAGEGLSHKEAATILDCAEGTVSWRMHKAKDLLAQLLDAQGGSQ